MGQCLKRPTRRILVASRSGSRTLHPRSSRAETTGIRRTSDHRRRLRRASAVEERSGGTSAHHYPYLAKVGRQRTGRTAVESAPEYAIVTPPAHGNLGSISANHIEYTPVSGYSGTDSFTFSARDPYSPFPKSPAIATVSIDVSNNPAAPSVAIEGAPASIIAGTSVQFVGARERRHSRSHMERKRRIDLLHKSIDQPLHSPLRPASRQARDCRGDESRRGQRPTDD